jgi:outer membrane PBP1 activator LpoA protein
MNRVMNVSIAALFIIGTLVGCSQKPAAENASQAIEQSKTQGTVQQQADYLVGQAKAFLNEKNYDQAMATANHVLSNLDQNSQAAKDILVKAKEDMQKTAQVAVDDMKNKLGGLGK